MSNLRFHHRNGGLDSNGIISVVESTLEVRGDIWFDNIVGDRGALQSSSSDVSISGALIVTNSYLNERGLGGALSALYSNISVGSIHVNDSFAGTSGGALHLLSSRLYCSGPIDLYECHADMIGGAGGCLSLVFDSYINATQIQCIGSSANSGGAIRMTGVRFLMIIFFISFFSRVDISALYTHNRVTLLTQLYSSTRVIQVMEQLSLWMTET